MTTTIMADDVAGEIDTGPLFWILLVVGILWILFSFLLLQFTYTSITAISVLVGIILILAGVAEIGLAFVARGWRWAHALLGVLFVAGGIFAFVYPGETFGTLSIIFAWYLLIKGTFDVIYAFMIHGAPLWWLELIVGVAEIAIAFWAVGYVGRSAALLLLWIGIGALMRGITTLIAAFHVRHGAREMI
jgi:uncharacterized membrane protein HdeD (DUF308 family)